MRLSGKVCIVTGAARGIGRAIALRLAREGASLALIDILGDELLKTSDEVKSISPHVLPIKADVSSPMEVKIAVEKILSFFGKVDVLVNNAGIFSSANLEDLSDELFEKVMSVNLKSAILLSQQVVPHMIRQGGGRIINMASTAGISGGYYAGIDYSISKAGIIALTKALARRLAKYRITVNAVAPGIIDTPMTQQWPERIREELLKRIPLGRFGRPEDVAGVVVFLASEDADYITGQVIIVDGGLLL
ncbi:MAG: SDR family NAD(P)-dependent oxidoreductase [Sulfolobales archaeon]